MSKMVQVFMVLRCFSCETFQVHQVKREGERGREGGRERETERGGERGRERQRNRQREVDSNPTTPPYAGQKEL